MLTADFPLAGIDIEGDGNSPIEPIETAISGPGDIERVYLTNPGRPISSYATQVHGLTDRDVRHAPPFDVYADEIRGLLGGVVVVGHGLPGDLAVLKRKIPDLNIGGQLDTLVVARRCLGRKSGLRLHALALETGARLPVMSGRGAHSALYDARLALNLLGRLEELYPKRVEEHLRDAGFSRLLQGP